MSTVFITGSGRRLGAGLALKFAEKGWNVALHYNSSKEKARETYRKVLEFGVKSCLVNSDVSDYKELENSFLDAADIIGLPDVLINNAGVFPKRKSIRELSLDEWDTTLNINLRGEFYASKIFAEKSKSGRIINISSVGGLEVWKNRIPYNVSKAGVIQLTKSLARSLAPDFSVNCICPGTIKIIGEAAADESEISTEKIPMKRIGTVDDIFDAAYFFASCSKYITGQILTVDGGYSLGR